MEVSAGPGVHQTPDVQPVRTKSFTKVEGYPVLPGYIPVILTRRQPRPVKTTPTLVVSNSTFGPLKGGHRIIRYYVT